MQSYGFDSHFGSCYTMELLSRPQMTLAAGQDASDAAKILLSAKLPRALAYTHTHRRNVIHRDIKPSKTRCLRPSSVKPAPSGRAGRARTGS